MKKIPIYFLLIFASISAIYFESIDWIGSSNFFMEEVTMCSCGRDWTNIYSGSWITMTFNET